MKSFVKVMVAIIGAVFLYGCQGPLDSDISEYFDIYGNKPSASNLPSEGKIDASNIPTIGNGGSENSGLNPEEIAKKIVGKWILIKYVFTDEVSKTYTEEDNRYMILNADYTYEVHPYTLFEAERWNGNWSLSNNQLIFHDHGGSDYSILKLTSTMLILGCYDEGILFELTTFRKAN